MTLSDSADLVIGCDGPHSAVRRLALGPEERFVKPLGGYNTWFTAPDTVGLDGWYLMYQAPGLNASMRPSHDPALCKAALAFRSAPIDYDRRNPDEQRHRQRFYNRPERNPLRSRVLLHAARQHAAELQEALHLGQTAVVH